MRLAKSITQFLSCVADGVDEYYLCRQKGCGYFSLSANWAFNDPSGGGQYRCPLCGIVFQPWVDNSKVVPCNKLWVVEHTGEGELQTMTGKKLKPGDVEYIPHWWPPTATTALQERLKEVFYEVDASCKDMTRADLLQKVKQLAEEQSVRSYWREMRMGVDGKAIIDQSNATGKKKYEYSHLESGFVGSTYIFREGTPVLTQADLARFWGYCRHAAHQAQRAMQD